jgi:hypothetical protein
MRTQFSSLFALIGLILIFRFDSEKIDDYLSFQKLEAERESGKSSDEDEDLRFD